MEPVELMAVAFDFRRKLGEGYFGEVWHAIDTGLNCAVALKCIPPDKILNQKNFYQEAQVLKVAEHTNIVRVNDTGTFNDGRIYVSMEYLPNGSLEDEASGAPLPLSRAKRLMIDVLRGLQHAHSNKIVHRDIKPANILIGNNGEAKLSDFGLALPDVSKLNLSYLIKYQYVIHLAPEVKKIEDYTNLSDIYSCGVTLYRLVNGDSYLTRPPLHELTLLTQSGLFPPRDKYRDFIPQSLKRLINKSINVLPEKRFQSADEMRHALEQQSFFIDWSESATSDSIIWEGIDYSGYHCKIVKEKMVSGRWNIETYRGKSQPIKRRMIRYCYYNIAKGIADKICRAILQAFVNGRA